MRALFSLGQVTGTPGALAALVNAGQTPNEFIARHASGDWGTVDAHDRRMNDTAVQNGSRIMSFYTTKLDEEIWVVTEADRSATTLLLPSEY